MRDLKYENHLEEYKKLFGYYVDDIAPDVQEKILGQAQQKAQYLHSMSVFDPLRDWFIKCVTIAPNLSNENAQYYLKHGAGRRFSMLFSAYQALVHIIHPEREEPLSHDEQQALSRDINIIYMNLRGVLDNFAWCLVLEKQSDLTHILHRNDISLFSKKFRKEFLLFGEIKEGLISHDEWGKDVKARRDPVAHRIPLYVPHTIVTEEEAKRYNDLEREFHRNINELDFESSDAAFEKMHNVGTFFPYFVHHPEEPPIPIYPTISTDLAHLIEIGDVVEKLLLG